MSIRHLAPIWGCTCLSLCLTASAADLPKGPTDGQKRQLAELQARIDERGSAGDFEAAVKAAERCAELRSESQGRDHWQTKNARLAIDMWCRRAKTPHAARTAWAKSQGMRSRAVKLFGRGRYAEATALLKEVLAARLQALGDGHVDIGGAYNDLATALTEVGKAGEALPLYREALANRLKTFGDSHPETALAYSNTAGCLERLGRAGEARPLLLKALAINRKSLGDRHPRTAEIQTSLALSAKTRQGGRGAAAPPASLAGVPNGLR